MKITRRFKITLIWILEKLYGDLGWIDLADSCGRGDETSRFIKCRGFIDWLANCYILKKEYLRSHKLSRKILHCKMTNINARISGFYPET